VPGRAHARPRDAASLVLLRGSRRDLEVLLGRRDPGSRFVPDLYVFPGGAVDRDDARARCASELRPSVARQLTHRASPTRARALAVAAVRETFEETGLACGRVERKRLLPQLDALDYLGRAITPTESPIRFHARFFVARARNLHGRLCGNGELHDLAWFPLQQALGLPMLDVTRLLIAEAAVRVGSPAAACSVAGSGSLFVHFRGRHGRTTREP